MINLLQWNKTSIFQNDKMSEYFDIPPFHPSEEYPEYPFGKKNVSDKSNHVYDAVRNALFLLGLDKENFNKPNWNPLGDIIKPGEKVVIKPNFVLDKHYKDGDINCVITHPSVIRAVCDFAYIALKGTGELVIADAPQANCDFQNLLRNSKLETISEFYSVAAQLSVGIYDLRQVKYEYNNKSYLDSKSRKFLEGDPLGYTIVDLSKKSEFISMKHTDRLYGADYDREETIKHHNGDKHEYCVSKTVLSADVIISVPKMKVHRKSGVTLNLKNLIGINGNKNYLPHFRIGLKEDGGDEFPELSKEQKAVQYTNRFLIDKLMSKPNRIKDSLYKVAHTGYRILRKVFPKTDAKSVIGAGDWSGNDTIWRTLLDLNKILLYSDIDGNLHDIPQRKFISVIDGIIAGENEGPLVPTAKPCGIIAAGLNPLVTDIALTRVMGFDINRIPKFEYALKLKKYKLSEIDVDNIEIKSNIEEYENAIKDTTSNFLGLKPAKGWINTIEINRTK
jgi:uncharacterized protein (DUF362 family)